jgi:hypothetical protein
MNPLLLVGLIVGGLVLIDVLLRLYGQRGGGRLASEADAIEQFRREYPEIGASELSHVVLTSDRSTAFFSIASGATGFVRSFGDRFVVRQLRPADIASLERHGETALNVRFNDVTLRRLRFEFASTADRDFAADALSAPMLAVRSEVPDSP